MFGHMFQMNFNRNGPSHGTNIGALCSLPINFFMIAYLIILILRVNAPSQDLLIFVNLAIDLVELGPVKITQGSESEIGVQY